MNKTAVDVIEDAIAEENRLVDVFCAQHEYDANDQSEYWHSAASYHRARASYLELLLFSVKALGPMVPVARIEAAIAIEDAGMVAGSLQCSEGGSEAVRRNGFRWQCTHTHTKFVLLGLIKDQP
jgi:hypothetical protein